MAGVLSQLDQQFETLPRASLYHPRPPPALHLLGGEGATVAHAVKTGSERARTEQE